MATPCEAFAQASFVFVGKATAIVEGGGSQEVTFAVTEKLKGITESTIVVEGGGMCGASFVKGKTYVVFTSAGTKPSVGLCSGTAPVERARDWVAYARGAGKRKVGVIEGTVVIDHAPRAGTELRVRGGKQRARTDKQGHYRLEVAPGEHVIDVVDAKATLPAETKSDVTVADAATCAKLDLALVWNGRVRGRVVGADGKPAANVQVTLVGTRSGNQFATTDAKGDYELSGVAAGEYTVVIYSARNVPKTTYFPSTDDATLAKPIKLSQSAVVQKIDIKLQP